MRRELSHLAISAILLSIAFGIALAGGIEAFKDIPFLFTSVWISFIGVSVGFVSHEMAHRFVAKKYGFLASYYMSPNGLGIALLISLTGWILAAPGAVRIYGNPNYTGPIHQDPKTFGIISLAGPLVNILLAIVFFIFGIIIAFIEASLGRELILWDVAMFGMQINAWLAAFNLLPFGPLDGRDIFKWNKAIWGAMLVFAIGLYIFIII